MTPSEFKAWFDGFTEAFDRLPTKTQWARIKERVSEIDGRPTTERIFVDRWWPTISPYVPYYPYHGAYYGAATIDCCQNNTGAAYQNVGNNLNALKSVSNTFEPTSAMLALGRADALSLQATA